MKEMADGGYVVKDTLNKQYFCGLNTWDKQLRKAKIYHSEKYATEIVEDPRYSNRTMSIVKVEIKEVDL